MNSEKNYIFYVWGCSHFVQNIYCSFRSLGLLAPYAFFGIQLGVLKNGLTSNSYVMGDLNDADLNLDAKMQTRQDYHRIPLSHLANFALEINMDQVLNFETWSRTNTGTKKSQP